MSSGHYAQGKKAWGICGRCGQRALLNDLVFDGYYPSLRVHERCYEAKHPQERLAPVNDRVALWRPSPEDYPIEPPVLELELGSVILTWSAAVSYHVRIETYTVYRAVNDGDAVQVAQFTNTYSYDGELIAQTLTYTDTDVNEEPDEDITYHYYVVASASNNRFSANSNIASITFEAVTDEVPPSAPTLTASSAPPANVTMTAGQLGAGTFGYNQGGIGEISGEFEGFTVIRMGDVDDGEGARFEIILVGGPPQELFFKIDIPELSKSYSSRTAVFADLDGSVRWRWMDDLAGFEDDITYSISVDEGYVADLFADLFVTLNVGTNTDPPPDFYGIGAIGTTAYGSGYLDAEIIESAGFIINSQLSVVARDTGSEGSIDFIVEFNGSGENDDFDTIIFNDRNNVFRKFARADATFGFSEDLPTTNWTWPTDDVLFNNDETYFLRFATAPTSDTVQLSWTASTPGSAPIQDYVIFRSVDGGGFEEYAITSELSYTDGPLSPGGYAYEVAARDTNLVLSSHSNTEGVTIT